MSRPILAVLAGTIAMALAHVPGASANIKCDSLDKRSCLLPWPSNHFMKRDGRTDTGVRLKLAASLFPKNAAGVPAFAADLNRGDGFSPGTAIMTYVPGLDLKRTGAVPVNDLRKALDPGQPIALVDARTGKRQLIWAELDAGATNPRDRVLMIHPATNLREGRRYVVALSRLRDSRGRIIPAGRVFRALRDDKRRGEHALDVRRGKFRSIFRSLKKAGIPRESLYLAWDFTVASMRNISERAAAIRDNAFAVLGDRNLQDGKIKGRAPAYRIDAVQEFAPCGADGCQAGENDNLARRVEGTLIAPCYLDRPGCPPGSRFRFRKTKKTAFTWIPAHKLGAAMDAKFTCIVPRAALDKPARPALYGHDLLGGPEEVMAADVQAMAQEHDFVFCSTREIGMADEDAQHLTTVLKDLSKLPSLVDRVQQGLLNGLLLGRLMVHPNGLVNKAAFRGNGGGPLIERSSLFYDGNGQGAILGGALTALAPDFQRAVLGAPGMNYSLLMPRGTGFDPQLAAFASAYPSRLERMVLLTVMQNLWDRGEANGYAHHMTGDPLPNSPLHSVLLQPALGDHQVAQVSAEIEARTLKAVGRHPVYDAGRSLDKIPFYGIQPAGSFTEGSAIVMWDGGPIREGGTLGTDVAPLGGVPPRAGSDPHGLVRASVEARRQKSEFLRGAGRLLEVCPTGRACRTY